MTSLSRPKPEGACAVKKERGSTLDRNLTNVCTNPWCIYQPAICRLVSKPNLDFHEEPLGIQHSNYARERNTLF